MKVPPAVHPRPSGGPQLKAGVVKASKQKFYAVREGRIKDVFVSWADCEAQVKGFKGAIHKSFSTREEAEQFVINGTSSSSTLPQPTANSELPSKETSVTTKQGQLSSASHHDFNTTSDSTARAWAGMEEAKKAANTRVTIPSSVTQPIQASATLPLGAPAPSSPQSPAAIILKEAVQAGHDRVRERESLLFGGAPAMDPDHHFCMNFDGASRGNPGAAGSGAVVVNTTTGEEVIRLIYPIPFPSSNNVAEYTALILGLAACQALGVRHLTCKGDSELILRQVEGLYKVKAVGLKPYNERAVDLVKSLKTSGVAVKLVHVRREYNTVADLLSNEAVDALYK